MVPLISSRSDIEHRLINDSFNSPSVRKGKKLGSQAQGTKFRINILTVKVSIKKQEMMEEISFHLSSFELLLQKKSSTDTQKNSRAQTIALRFSCRLQWLPLAILGVQAIPSATKISVFDTEPKLSKSKEDIVKFITP